MEIKAVSLTEYSSLQVGGTGNITEVRNAEELRGAVAHAKNEGLRVHIIGQGTNSYFGNDLSQFLFIKPEFKGIEFMEEGDCVRMHIQGSEIWDDVVKESVNRGLWGIENLSYIPGTAGAAPVQNIGAYGVELKEVLESLSAFDVESLEVVEFKKEDCAFGYRDSIFKHKKDRYIIMSLTLKLAVLPQPVLTYKPLDMLTAPKITSAHIRDVVIRTRTAKLPDWKENPNAGSFFKNPIVDFEISEYLEKLYPAMPLIQVKEGYKIPAAWLIEHVAEMKGARRGDIGTWPSQPLVIVNYGTATADDIDTFAKEIKERVHKKTGVVLEQEVNRVG